jgi:hypothetical protein
MDIDVDSISKRGGFGNERYERRDFQLKVWDAYQVTERRGNNEGRNGEREKSERERERERDRKREGEKEGKKE